MAVPAVAAARSDVLSMPDASRADIEEAFYKPASNQLGEQDVDRLLAQYLGESS